jgi:hypothetical protein
MSLTRNSLLKEYNFVPLDEDKFLTTQATSQFRKEMSQFKSERKSEIGQVDQVKLDESQVNQNKQTQQPGRLVEVRVN